MVDNKILEFAKCAKDPVYYMNNYGYVFDAKKKMVAPMKCFEYQNDCIRKFHKNQNNIILKSRQCLPGDTYVDTPQGYKSIKDFKVGDEVYSYNLLSNEVEVDTVYDAWCSGDNQCVEIEFDNTESIESGENHPFYDINKKEWVIAKNLTNGDEVLNFKKEKSVVIKVIKTDIKKCYDISVTKNENFFVDGLLVHNTGLSVVTAGYVAWRLMFRYDEKILIIANDGTGAMRFLATVKQFIEYTPDWLKPDAVEQNNTKKIAFSNNSYAEAKASSPNAGRGDSLTMLVLDETAFIKDDEDIWMGAGMALSQTGGKCIMISTPNGTSGLYYKTWRNAINNDNDFVGTTVHWTENPISSEGLEYRTNEQGDSVAWSPWYESQCKRLDWDSVKIAQELDLSFEGSKRLAIDPLLIVKYRKRVDDDCKVDSYLSFDFLEKDNLEKFANFTNQITNMQVFKKPEEGRQYIIGCLPPGEKVLTNSGLKNIEEIDFADKLIDKNGLEVDIKNIQITKGVDDYVYEIRPSNVYRKTKFTKDHPILVCNDYKLKRNYNPNHDVYRFNERYWDLKFDFVNASELKVGDWLVYPNIYFGKDKNEEFIKSKFTQFSDNSRKDFVIDENIVLDEEFWWFVGIWLAEGWVQSDDKYKYSVHTCHNLTEELAYVERLDSLFKKYGRNISTVIKGDCNAIETVFGSKQIYNFLLSNFGKYADGKYISEWVKYIPENLKIKLLEGYLNGDGSWFKDSKRGNSTISYVSVSLELLESIQDILFSIGLISNLNLLRHEKESKIRDRVVLQKNTYQLTLCHYDSLRLIEKIGYEHDFEIKNNRTIKDCFLSKDNKFIHFRIKDFEKIKYEGDVYNFETETHTYLCRNITTHNCDVARGDGNDFSTIQVIDVVSLEQVAEYRDKIGPDLFPFVINYVARMYNTAYVAIEANSFGLGVCFDIRDKFKYPRNRLHFSKNVQDMHVSHYKYKINEGTEIPGFQTTGKNRVLLIKSIIQHMRENSLILHSKKLIAEFETFIMNGEKPEHEKGANDDLIMALGIGLYIRDTEFENVTNSTEMYKSMLNAMMLNTNSSVGRVPTNDKKDSIPKGGGGLYLFNGENNNFNINGNDDDDLSWLLS